MSGVDGGVLAFAFTATFEELKQAIWATTFSERIDIQQNGLRIYMQALKLEDELGLRTENLGGDDVLLAKETITSEGLAQVLKKNLGLYHLDD